MLNREGGDILLGVADDAIVRGVEASRLEIIKSNLVTCGIKALRSRIYPRGRKSNCHVIPSAD
jgi:hypothetical protein